MDKIYLRVFHLLAVLAVGSCQMTPLNEPCHTKFHNGTCVLMKDCPAAINLLQIQDVTTLRMINCGFEDKLPKVCCNLSSGSTITFYNTTEEAATARPKKTTSSKLEAVTSVPEISVNVFPNRSVCGQVKDSDRIYGGSIADIDEFPWLARIKYVDKLEKKPDSFACTASLITNQYLVTAAHCVLNTSTLKPISVRLGEWDEQTEIDCYENQCSDKPVDVNINKIIIHPKFSSHNKSNYDIALIQLEKPVAFSDFIQPVCLPTTEYVANQDYVKGSSYTTAGWGKTEFGNLSPIKLKVKLEAVPSDVCGALWHIIPKLSLPNLICAGGRTGKDTCRGDSGGPLVKEVSEDYQINWYIFGITSFGYASCGTEGYPGIYTRVSLYVNWIRDEIVKNINST